MTQMTAPGEQLRCPSCGTLNQPRAMICISCGIHMQKFRDAQTRIQDVQEDAASDHLAQLTGDASQVLKTEKARIRQQFKVQLWLLALGSVILLLIVVGIVSLTAFQVQQRRAALAADYAEASACLDAENYICARDGFVELLDESPDYDGAEPALRTARIGLARQYIALGEWRKALSEIDMLEAQTPGDPELLALRTEVYDAWNTQARSCLDGADYLCARASFLELMHVAPGYQPAREGLHDARAGLVSQYVAEGEWHRALSEISVMLAETPGDAEALALSDGVYAAWTVEPDACLDAQDYQCARAGYIEILSDNRDYQPAQAGLHDARMGLAGQYADSGQWREAIAELDVLLSEMPGDEEALVLMEDIYNRWIADALSREDLWTAALVMLQRDARFPSE
jgi:tetratricopeptide (TPR) repeat protein